MLELANFLAEEVYNDLKLLLLHFYRCRINNCSSDWICVPPFSFISLPFLIRNVALNWMGALFFLFQSFFLLNTVTDELSEILFFSLSIIINLESVKLYKKRDKNRVHQDLFREFVSAFILETILDIFIMYSLIFLLPLWRILTNLWRFVLASTLSVLVNRLLLQLENS